MDKLQVLLSKGYFPKELPPPFTTEDFGKYARELFSTWTAKGPLKSCHAKHQKVWEISETEPELYSMPKAKNERRQLHITNPVPQLLLASVMTKNWATVSRWLDRQRFCFSRTTISSKAERAIEEPDFKSNAVHKQLIRATYDVEVKSDVLRFYPSIYTHSIPWAVYGKDRVKKNRKKYNDSLGDRIDVLLRKCNRGQSVGIPIGPDTSRIVADILSGYVDSRLLLNTALARGAADRLQDDWVIGTETVEDAERLLSALRTTYLEVGLEIHGGKTSVIGIVDNVGTPWVHTLQVAARINSVLTGTALQNFCEVALDLQKQNPGDRPLRYALSLIQGSEIKVPDASYLQSFLMRALMVDTRNIDFVASLLINMRHEGRTIHESLITKRLTSMIKGGLERGEHFETAWALFLMKGLALPLQLGAQAALLAKIESPAICLLILDLSSRGLASEAPIRDWERRVKAVAADGPDWLLAYEGVRHGWLADSTGAIRADPMLKPLFDRNVVFYDDKRNVPTTKKAVTRRRRRSKRLTTAMLWRIITSKYI